MDLVYPHFLPTKEAQDKLFDKNIKVQENFFNKKEILQLILKTVSVWR